PIDPHSAADVAWLETLVWPEQEGRLRGLQAAIAIARRERPTVVKGDLSTDLEALIAAAPQDATLVVFHTAVLAYVTPQQNRDRFADVVRRSRAVWISNEAPGVFPALSKPAPPTDAPGSFLLMRDGVPLAWTRPHGQSIDWFDGR